MTDHPLDTEALRREALGQLGRIAADPRWPGRVLSLLDLLAAAEHRATRAEAQSAIRGRAVLIYQQRARQAEAERDRWHSMWRQRGVKHLAAEKRATRAQTERDEWRQTALDERGAALDLLEQIKVRDKRIQAVQHLVDQADHAGNWTVTCTHLQRAIDQ